MLEKIWVEKYRPKQIKHLIGNENLKKSLQDYLDKGEIPNILLYGPPGTGKTTIAKIVRSVLDCDHLFINGSDENNVETVRNKIGTFGSSVSFSKLNLVIIDEMDYLGQNAQAILRNMIEEFYDNTRFIFTCVREGTKVYTSYGYKLCNNLNKGDNVYVSEFGETENKLVIKNKGNDLIRIKTLHGFQIDVTQNHLFRINKKDICSKELKIGDKIDIDLKSIYGNDFESTNDDNKIIDEQKFKKFLLERKIPNNEILDELKKYHKFLIIREVEFCKLLKIKKEYSIQELRKVMKLPLHRVQSFVRKAKLFKIISYENNNKKTLYTYNGLSEINKIVKNLNDKFDINWNYIDYLKASKKSKTTLSQEEIINNLGKLINLKNNEYKSISSLGRIIGFLYGDGHLCKNQLHFAANNRFTLEEVIKDLSNLGFDVDNQEIRINGKNTNGLAFILRSKSLYLLFKYLGCCEGNKVKQRFKIPKIIDSSLLMTSRFIQSLFDCESLTLKLDQKNNKTIQTIRFSQRILKQIYDKNNDFVQQISNLLKNKFNINNQVKILIVNNGYGKILDEDRIERTINISEQESIKNFCLKIGNHYEKKKIKIDFLGYLLYKEVQKGYNYLTFDEWRKNYYLENIHGLNDEIIGIKKISGQFNVYDLSMNENHYYSSNGFVSHNCNYPQKIMEALQSRMQSYEVRPPNIEDIETRMKKILEKEEIKFKEQDLKDLVKNCFPDIRKTINTLQRFSIDGELKVEKNEILGDAYKSEIINMIKKNKPFEEIRTVIINSSNVDYTLMFRMLFDSVDEYCNVKDKKSNMLLDIAEHLYRDTTIVDKEINLSACVLKILKHNTK